MQAFITGSHAYGSPRADSDIDLVVCIHWTSLEKLQQASDAGVLNQPIRFGKLNIIDCPDEKEFSVWKVATDALVMKAQAEKRPIGRQEAIEFIDKIRVLVGIEDRGQSR